MKEQLIESMRATPVLDSHTHLSAESNRSPDLLAEYMSQYFGHDLLTAGMKKRDFDRLLDITVPRDERFALVKPWLAEIRNTAYYRCLTESVRVLTGCGQISEESLPLLNDYYVSGLREGYYAELFRKNKIVTAMIDHTGFDWKYTDYPFYTQSYNTIHLFAPYSDKLLDGIEQFSGIRIRGLDSYLAACEALLRKKAEKQGVKTLKLPLAYVRKLHFPQSLYGEAEEEFNAVFSKRILHRDAISSGYNFDGCIRFQNYLMHRIMPLAEELGLTVQFHTGYLAGHGSYLPNSRPDGLIPLFHQYPDINFDIFHMAYPYQGELGAIAKNYPNVYVNLCWAHILSPTAVVAALNEWLDILPSNKIIGFGSDVHTLDLAIGGLEIARQNIATALESKIKQGLMDLDEAKYISEKLFYHNPMKLYL